MSLRILLLAVLASSAMAITVNQCQNGKLPLEVQVIGCEEQPCVIYREGDVSALVDFNVSKKVDRLKALVRATAFGETVDYDLPEPDACKTLLPNANCPIEVGDIPTYKLDMHLTPDIPPASVVVELRVVNPDAVGSEDVIFCFSIELEVIDRPLLT